MQWKNSVCAVLGLVGGIITAAFGGWNAALAVLLACMALDYVSGLVVAGVFHKSPKSSGGGLSSGVGWKGLARKAASLLLVIAAHFLDTLLHTTYVRDAVVIAFCANELLSITENCGLMGVPIPRSVRKAIDLLRNDENRKS